MNSLALTLLPYAACLAGDISLFEYTSAPEGSVRVIDETGVVADSFPASLQAIELLPVDFIGRTAWDQLQPHRPRLRESLAAPRIRLPGGQGALYAFRRDEGGSHVFGYFRVDVQGSPMVLLERPGTGIDGSQSPYCPKLAVEDGGATLLVATLPAAGGDLLEVDVATGSVEDRTALLSPRTFQMNGLALLSGWGLASTPTGLLRFERTPGAQARNVPFGGGIAAFASFPSGQVTATRTSKPDWFGPDLVASADGTTAAFCAGKGATEAFVYTVRQAGKAIRLTTQAYHLSGAGFLPESPIGPTLALSPDGGCVAWRAESPVSAETFVELVATPQAAPLQLTADANYTDTLNDSGVITFASPDELVMLVGETDSQDPLQIDRADLYRVNIANLASPAFSNLSMTSGDGVVPFLLPGTLDTDAGLVRTPDGLRALALASDSGGSGSLLTFDLATTQATSLFGDVKEWDLIASTGTDLVLALRRDFVQNDRELYRWLDGGTPQLVFALSGDGFFDWSLNSDRFAAIATDNMGAEILGRVELTGGFAESMGPVQGMGPTLDHGAAGALGFSLDGATQSFYYVWETNSAITPLHFGAGKGFLLPRD